MTVISLSGTLVVNVSTHVLHCDITSSEKWTLFEFFVISLFLLSILPIA